MINENIESGQGKASSRQRELYTVYVAWKRG